MQQSSGKQSDGKQGGPKQGGIVLEGVSRVFAGGIVAVDHINLEVYDKEFLVLVGPSGCGKSTTLRMIAGLEDVSGGEIRIGGRRVNNVPPKDRDIAMVFQSYALYPHMTVRKNMAFGLELRSGTGWLRRTVWRVLRPSRGAELTARRKQIGEKIERAAHILGIAHLLGRMPRELSGGERQRVALGRAIVREPVAFLFDEPLSNLDARLRVEMRRELKELHRRLAATMVYVTHDQVEALTLGQRIVVMDRGVIQQVGAPLEVYDRPRNRFVAGFIGTPPMNFIQGTVGGANGQREFCCGRVRLELGAGLSKRLPSRTENPCVLGVRPEDVGLRVGEDEGTKEPTDEVIKLAGIIDLVEPLGDATLVTVCFEAPEMAVTEDAGVGLGLRHDGKLHSTRRFCVVSKCDSHVDWRVGQPVQAVFSAQRVHLFDANTGENVSPAPGLAKQAG